MKIVRILSVLSAVLFLSGCGTTAKFVYPAKGSNLVNFPDGPIYDKKIAVTPFDDSRGDTNSAGTIFLYLIPLMPYGWVEYERPDAARMFLTIAEFDFTPSEDLAKAAAYSFRRSNLFKDAFFTYGGEKDKADYLFHGEIISTKYDGTMFSYGLSIYGPIFHYLGLPSGRSYNVLTLNLKLTDIKSSKILWDKNYDKAYAIMQGLYYSFGDDIKGYPKLMQDIMNDAITDINKTLRKESAADK